MQTLCEQMAEMRKEDAYMHLYGEVWNYHSFFDTSCTHTITDYYDQPADPIYQQWCSEEREVIIREAKIIPLPKNDETLGGYLSYLVSEVSEGNEHRYIWIKSLRSFLQFLRDDMPFDQKGYLERLFPSDQGCKGMKFQKETHYSPKGKKIQSIKCQVILRRVEKTIYPIDIFTTAEILKNLIAAILEGRPNGQHSAAEALGFAWLSIFVGRLRIMTQEQMVFATKRSGFKNLKTNPTADLFSPTRFITVDTLDGAIDVPVSKMVYEYLSALSCDS
ncbi:MAG: hypothetical protein KDK40_05855 [Chlamydiia bacterium]|nr:hypothetical protein [Chlamydiia bacterium]